MSDNHKHTHPMEKTSIARNEVNVEFEPLQFKKGADKGKLYLGVDKVKDKFDDVVKWLGIDVAANVIQRAINSRCQGLLEEATDYVLGDDGKTVVSSTVDVKQLITMIGEFSVRGESMAELKQQVADLTDELVASDKSTPEGLAKMVSIIEEIAKLQASIAQKHRERKPDEAVAA